eukprot:COSAG01_NODE_7725_length_3082_cov_204.291988_1_plen_41_part_00
MQDMNDLEFEIEMEEPANEPEVGEVAPGRQTPTLEISNFS